MNLKSEQINPDLSITIDFDQCLSKSQMFSVLKDLLGPNANVKQLSDGNKYFIYKNASGKDILLLVKAVSYLGGNGQHPLFKKRVQLPKSYKDIVEKYGNDYDVRFIGLYHYNGLIVFVDFEKNSYIAKKMNNSAAHVYINDLYQAIKNNSFKKTDKNFNVITTISSHYFKKYLDEQTTEDNLFSIFKLFNTSFDFGKWVIAIDAIREMYDHKWKYWRETEWAGWYLEYKYSDFINKNNLEKQIKYMGLIPKSEKEYDFDLYFAAEDFYGDLKASDISKKEAPGNDKSKLLECINRFDKFWYVIYEHETNKGIDNSADQSRELFFRSADPTYIARHSISGKHRPIKNSINFKSMLILEINRVNYRNVLIDFNQGVQIDGNSRNPKFIIKKKDIDNFVVYRYQHEE